MQAACLKCAKNGSPGFDCHQVLAHLPMVAPSANGGVDPITVRLRVVGTAKWQPNRRSFSCMASAAMLALNGGVGQDRAVIPPRDRRGQKRYALAHSKTSLFRGFDNRPETRRDAFCAERAVRTPGIIWTHQRASKAVPLFTFR
jgi:hypothetical protein